jgi:glycosyltransferase involved in cell wall biosynthesis
MEEVTYGNTNPLVSVGVASYNNSRYIIETLDSIANQTYKNIEVLINDDASSDNSVALINDWIKKHDKINASLFVSPANQGICKAGNNILKKAKGKYVCLIGSDDRYLPEFIEKRVQFLENSSKTAGFCYSLTNIMDTEGNRVGIDYRSTPSGEIFNHLTSGFNSLCKPFTCLIKTECFQNVGYYDESLLYEDYDWFLRASKKYEIIFFDSIDTEFRIVPGSLGSKLTTNKGILSQLAIIKKHLGYSKSTDENFRERLYKLALKGYKNKLPAAREILITSIKQYKGFKESMLFLLTFIPVTWLRKIKKGITFFNFPQVTKTKE